MATPQHERLRALFDQARELPPAARDAWLAEACAGDQALLGEIQSLLAADDSAGAFLSTPLGHKASQDDALAAGLRLGAWEVVRPLGRGGMGVVYFGVRADDEYRKQVAIKVMTAAVGEEAARRFTRERQSSPGSSTQTSPVSLTPAPRRGARPTWCSTTSMACPSTSGATGSTWGWPSGSGCSCACATRSPMLTGTSWCTAT